MAVVRGTPDRVRPVDRLVAIYNVLLALLWLTCIPLASYAIWAAVAHLGASSLPLPLRRWRPGRRSLQLLRDLYPMLMIPAFWTEIDLLFPLRHAGTFDPWISALEDTLFGMQVAAEWMPGMPQLWLSELMHFSYFAYYGAIYLPPILLCLGGRTAAAKDMVFRLLVSYLACYVIYLFFPVDGPHFRLDHYEGELTGGFFYRLVELGQKGDSRGCAFPSSHVVGSATIAFLAWRWLSRPWAIALTAEAVGVVCSTVYTQNHYAVDAVAGVGWTLALQLSLAPLLLRRLEGSGGRVRRATDRLKPPVPVLWTGHAPWRSRWAP